MTTSEGVGLVAGASFVAFLLGVPSSAISFMCCSDGRANRPFTAITSLLRVGEKVRINWNLRRSQNDKTMAIRGLLQLRSSLSLAY